MKYWFAIQNIYGKFSNECKIICFISFIDISTVHKGMITFSLKPEDYFFVISRAQICI